MEEDDDDVDDNEEEELKLWLSCRDEFYKTK